MNSFYASEDGHKLGIFEGDSNHVLFFNLVPSMDMLEVKIMDGQRVEARFTVDLHDNQYGRKYEGLLAIEHYMERIREIISKADNNKVS